MTSQLVAGNRLDATMGTQPAANPAIYQEAARLDV
jgi:hypothetical protein